ncbi:hypothetical protein VO63_22335 [Streptomyces showdoensis]|uniref:AB hydrolase-1 domain-containing protein n=1 Tax=Streptomyces showdoensis TaxID=68268 RepID=A0A2P2GJN3_STREW|nr:hypothetical protein VO63_22335 [Streptomyces showdoensis]
MDKNPHPGVRVLAASAPPPHTTCAASCRTGSDPVGRGLEHQLRPLADDLVGHHLQDCGHIVPLDRPNALSALLDPFLSTDLP